LRFGAYPGFGCKTCPYVRSLLRYCSPYHRVRGRFELRFGAYPGFGRKTCPYVRSPNFYHCQM
jgi:hypothetical protein